MELHLRIEGKRELASQIYRQIRGAIVDGQLDNGQRLPPTRELAQRLGVSRNTVSLAYEWLASRGLIASRAGAGSFVDHARPPVPVADARRAAPLPQRSIWRELGRDFGRMPGGRFDFRPGVPDPNAFPYATWRRLTTTQLSPAHLDNRYGDAAGHPALRAAIAAHVSISRGLAVRAEDVIITHGTQHALDLIARVVVEHGTTVAVEDPGYPPAHRLFASHGARVAGVRVDAEGMDPGALPDDARLIYVTPAHQYPLGITLSTARRRELLAWAEQRNAIVVEDDYDSEFRFRGRPMDALHGMDHGRRVVYVGTFSKTLLPGLRLGYLIAPEPLRESLLVALFTSAGLCQWPAQGALAQLIAEGSFARHVRKSRRTYAERFDRVATLLRRDFHRWLLPVESTVGMHLTARLRGGVDLEHRITDAAARCGIGLHGLSSYALDAPPEAGLVLGYGGIDLPQIEEGLRVLRECFVTAERGGRDARSQSLD